ncbi:uncharacterized protein LOC122575527 isoform X3 [Bombus pyrosoma]|uniref:uncharacterized protein LOC122575527 isoform X3 n=1 Tax=Bombus pyrosoma TaxID=396416 RepID=UPI001CB9CE69|nr:uncharacterized protein LOC122575527 isoform X3 [Bombus pyrosoma]
MQRGQKILRAISPVDCVERVVSTEIHKSLRQRSGATRRPDRHREPDSRQADGHQTETKFHRVEEGRSSSQQWSDQRSKPEMKKKTSQRSISRDAGSLRWRKCGLRVFRIFSSMSDRRPLN